MDTFRQANVRQGTEKAQSEGASTRNWGCETQKPVDKPANPLTGFLTFSYI